MSKEQSRANQRHHEGSFSELYHSWRYLFWLLGLGCLVVLFYAEENWRGHRAWENYKQLMTSRGESSEPAAFIPPTVPDEQNFAMTPALAPLFDFVPGTQRWRDPNAPRLFQELTSQYDAAAALVKPGKAQRINTWIRARTDLNLWAAAFSQPPDIKPRGREPLLATNFSSRDAAAKVLEGLSDFKPVLDEIRTASSKRYARFNLRYQEDNPAGILLPHLAKIKYLCQVLQLRASAQLALGHPDEALQDLDLLLYLTDTTRNEPILISQFVRMAELQLALQPLAEGMGQWSEPQLLELQNRLSRLDFCSDINHSLQAERILFGGGVIEYLRRSHNKLRVLGELERSGPGDNTNGALPIGALFAVAPGGWLYLEQLNYGKMFDRYLLPVVDVTNHLIQPEAVALAEGQVSKLTEGTPLKRFLQHDYFSALLVPALSKTSQKVAFAQTAVDTATLACALERYRLANGQFPDALEKLSPKFIAAVPHDIITGKPLSYHVSNDGHFVLYSVGWNQKDDGGQVRHSPSGELDQKEGDWVWTDGF